MKYDYLRGTGLKVSQVALGSTTFGDQLDDQSSYKILDAAMDAGINLIDTGDVYCGGNSERIIGDWAKGKRGDVLLTTKMDLPMGSGVNNAGASRYHILNALEASMKRLQTDYVDIYYIHHPDRNTPMEETLQTMDQLVRDGKIRYYGFSNYSAWEGCDLVWTAKANHFIPPVVCQNVYNVITRGLEPELSYFVKKHNLGLVTYNPLAGGLLTGKHKKNKLAEGTRYASSMYQERYCNDANFNAIDALTAIAKEAGISLTELSVRWAISNDFVDSTLMGFSKIEQMEQNLGFIEKGALPMSVLEGCDGVWKAIKGDTYDYFIPNKGAKGVTYSGSLK